MVGTIPLNGDPNYGLMGPANRFLYVVHNDGLLLPEKPSEMAIVDLERRELIRNIPLGWNALQPSLTTDLRYLICFSHGRLAKEARGEAPARVTIVDARDARVVDNR